MKHMKQTYLIDEEDFQRLLERLSAIEAAVIAKEEAALLNRWLTNKQLMDLLEVSKRTLQNWRDTGTISFSPIGHKIYYQYRDVEAMLQYHKSLSFR
jgi:hypothetical protein